MVFTHDMNVFHNTYMWYVILFPSSSLFDLEELFLQLGAEQRNIVLPVLSFVDDITIQQRLIFFNIL
jgi:hypothetical protein